MPERRRRGSSPWRSRRTAGCRASRGQLTVARRARSTRPGGTSPGAMMGKPHGSSEMSSGSSSAHTPAPSQATGSTTRRNRWRLIGRPPAAAGTGRNGRVVWHGPRCRCSAAWSPKTSSGAPHEAGHPVRVVARPPALDQSAQRGEGGRPAPQRPGPVGEELELGGQDVEPVDARAALAGPLALHVADDAGGLGERADAGREEHDDTGADRRAEAAGGLLGEGHGQRRRRGQPATPVPAEEHRLDAWPPARR